MTGLGCLLFPLGGSLPCWLCTRLSGGGSGLLQQVLPQGLLPLSWGCGQEPRHAGSGPKHLHMSLLGRRCTLLSTIPHAAADKHDARLHSPLVVQPSCCQ